MIVGVAIIIDGEVRSLPKPSRHHDIIKQYPRPDYQHGEQGFISDNGTFLRRAPAAIHAIGCGQIRTTRWGNHLYSEDLW